MQGPVALAQLEFICRCPVILQIIGGIYSSTNTLYTGFLVVSNITTFVLPPDVAVAVVGGKELKSPDSGAMLRLAMFDLVVSVRRFLH